MDAGAQQVMMVMRVTIRLAIALDKEGHMQKHVDQFLQRLNVRRRGTGLYEVYVGTDNIGKFGQEIADFFKSVGIGREKRDDPTLDYFWMHCDMLPGHGSKAPATSYGGGESSYDATP